MIYEKDFLSRVWLKMCLYATLFWGVRGDFIHLALVYREKIQKNDSDPFVDMLYRFLEKRIGRTVRIKYLLDFNERLIPGMPRYKCAVRDYVLALLATIQAKETHGFSCGRNQQNSRREN